MWIIGDAHGQFKTYKWAVEKMIQPSDFEDMPYEGDLPASVAKNVFPGGKGMDYSIQIGDMGILAEDDLKKIDNNPNHRFFRGNHDNPQVCKMHPCYMGDFGYMEDLDLFWVAGGYSVDKAWRKPYVSWWPDEELSAGQMGKAFKLYKETKPKYMLSHECPTLVKDEVITNNWKLDITSSTEKGLQAMWEEHQPNLWVFGHHHTRKHIHMVKGVATEDSPTCEFVCLDELMHGNIKDCIFEIPGLKF